MAVLGFVLAVAGAVAVAWFGSPGAHGSQEPAEELTPVA